MESFRVINGSNTRAQMKSIDTILARLTRRQQIKKSYFVSPVVFSNYLEEIPEDLIVLRFMAGIEGTLARLAAVAEVIPEGVKGGELSVEVVTNGVSRKSSAWVKSGKGIIDDELSVEPTSQVKVGFSESHIGGVWVSALIIPSIDARFVKTEKVTGDE